MNEAIQKDVLRFIKRFHGSEDVFLHGCCYWFAMILNIHFYGKYGAQIKYEPVEGHFVTRIRGRYYDVRGDVTEEYRGKPMYDMYEMRSDDYKMYSRLMRDCRDFEEVDPDG